MKSRGAADAPCLLGVALLLVLSCPPALTQSLPGTSGLVSIPTAAITADGDIVAGVNVIAPHYHEYYGGAFDAKAAQVQFVTVGFLSFVEVGLRLTRIVDGPPQGIGDRMVS